MSDWDTASAAMDAAVDDRLGDTIQFSPDGVVPFGPVQGFVLPWVEGIGLGEIDTNLGSRWRIKIAKTIIPEPNRQMRFTHPKLGADTYRPAGDDPEEQGRYWIMDIQKVDA